RRKRTSSQEPGAAPRISWVCLSPRGAWPAVWAEEPRHKQEAVVADTVEVAVADTVELAASWVGGKPLVAPLVEAAPGTPASAASRGEAAEPWEPQGSHSRQAEATVDRVGVEWGSVEEPQRYLC